MHYICMYNMHYIHNKMTLFSKWRERERERERMTEWENDRYRYRCMYIYRERYADTKIDR